MSKLTQSDRNILENQISELTKVKAKIEENLLKLKADFISYDELVIALKRALET